jgi:hypothetical protein
MRPRNSYAAGWFMGKEAAGCSDEVDAQSCRGPASIFKQARVASRPARRDGVIEYRQWSPIPD